MTLNEAIMQLVTIWNNPMCPAIFKPTLNKVIETISELEEKLIETISEPEEPCEQVLGESCEIEQYAETCEECGFCDTISRQQAGKAVKEPVKPVYVWASTSLKEIEAVGALVQNVIKQTQDIILARIEELPAQCDNQPLTINMNLDEEQTKRMLEMLKKGGAIFVERNQEDEWLPVDLEHNQPPLEEWVLVSSEEHVTRDAVVIRNGKKIWYHEGEILEDDRWRYPPEPYHPDRNENRENQTRKEV